MAAGALNFEDALKVVRRRGEFMQEAVPAGEGAMAALLGCDIETVRAVCVEASELGVCAPANMNSPSQTVIAGHKSAVERAVELAKQKGRETRRDAFGQRAVSLRVDEAGSRAPCACAC